MMPMKSLIREGNAADDVSKTINGSARGLCRIC